MESLFGSGFMPHVHCYLGQASLIWTMVVTDTLIGGAYVAISIMLWRLILRTHVPYSAVVVCFGVFIGACGATHFMEVWTLWHPDYWASAALKLITAAASVGTGVYLYQLRPAIIALAEAARLSAQRKLDLERAALELESRVRERTQTLRASEAMLKESEAKFRTIADAMPQMIWSTTPAGQHDYFNQRWYEFTGLSGSAGHNAWLALVHPEDATRVEDRWQNTLATGENYDVEFRLRHRDGTYRWVLVRALPVRDATHAVIRWMGTCTDIHDQKQVQNDLAAAVQARDEFLSIASHELKTPLTSLKLQSQLARREIQRGFTSVYEKDNVDFMVMQTEKQVNRLTRLVDDMLDIARIRSGRLTLEREDVDLCEVVGEVIERLQPQFTANGCAAPALPSCADARGTWDRLRLEQVVTNLLTNAIRYGQGAPIRVDVTADAEAVCFHVTDGGIGIASEVRSRIFDRFERAVDANEVSGLGLGLFITKQIVEAHAGHVTVVSEVGRGSTFEVALPRAGGRNIDLNC